MSLPFWLKLIKLLKLLAGDGDSSVRLITLHIPFSLALHRLSLSVLSNSSRFSKASLSTARYIVPVAYYDSVTHDAAPVSYYPWKDRFLFTVTCIKQSNRDLCRSHYNVQPTTAADEKTKMKITTDSRIYNVKLKLLLILICS